MDNKVQENQYDSKNQTSDIADIVFSGEEVKALTEFFEKLSHVLEDDLKDHTIQEQTIGTLWAHYALRVEFNDFKLVLQQLGIEDDIALDTLGVIIKPIIVENQKLKLELEALKKAPAKSRAGSARGRKLGAIVHTSGKEKGKAKPNDKPDDLLTLIGMGKTVEIAFSDGKKEVPGLSPQIVSGDAWAVSNGRLALKLPTLNIVAPPGAASKVAGYALMVDGNQCAYCARMDVLTLAPGQTYDLKNDIVF